jgi:hypothetical protein
MTPALLCVIETGQIVPAELQPVKGSALDIFHSGRGRALGWLAQLSFWRAPRAWVNRFLLAENVLASYSGTAVNSRRSPA